MSYIPSDGRVLRQMGCLRAAGWQVTAVGCAANETTVTADQIIDGIRHVLVPRPIWSMRARLSAGVDLLHGRLSDDWRAARDRALRLPGLKELSHQVLAIAADAGKGRQILIVANDWMALPAALLAQEKFGVPFHYDSHELAVAEHETQLAWKLLFPHTIAAIERQAVRHARSISTVSPGIADWLRRSYRLTIAPTVTLNVPDAEALPPSPVGQTHSVLYHGLFKPDRGLMRLIDSVADWPDHFLLTLRGDAPQPRSKRALQKKALNSIARERIALEAAVQPDDVMRAANRADIGVFLPDLETSQNRYCLPNKLFEYLQAGLMVIVPAETDMAAIVAAHRCGIVLDDASPTGLARALSRLTADDIRQYKAAAHAAAQTLSWQQQSRHLSELFAIPLPPH